MSAFDFRSIGVCLIVATGVMAVSASAQRGPAKPDKATTEQHLKGWKPKPREVAQMMIAKYGQPSEATDQRLIWLNNGPWKFTEVVDEEIPHDFPMPHTDIVFQAIDYRVPNGDNAKALFDYDGSVMIERTKGELAARCDKEEANFLAINLAHDIVSGKRTAADARKFYADTMMGMMKGKMHPYLQGFQFQVAKGAVGDRDKPFKE